MKQILKRLGGVLGTEEVVDRAADELDKSYPGLSRKILIIIVSSSIGAITTWGIAIDGRVYDLKEAVALRQTIVEERKLLLALEQRVSDTANLNRRSTRCIARFTNRNASSTELNDG